MMQNIMLTSCYVLHQKMQIWARPDYAGISYNDGDDVERHIAAIIKQSSDLTVLSTELRQQCTDWPTLYHLSGTRANVLRPFAGSLTGDILEIGAGCGAITRYLGECGANVLALEGSPRRAAIARSRTSDLENVTVLAEKFDAFQCNHKFDVITLIGVLEYANLFTEAEYPSLTMLQQVRSLLKPDGKLIIAIENQLGLKYFAGAPEDHLNQPMFGIEGRYRKDQPQTFGRKVLASMLEQAGFIASEFLAPFPDYKLPVSILTEKSIKTDEFDAAALAWQSVRRDPQLPPYCNFSLELAWPEIFQNGMALDVANSFLVIASQKDQKFFNSNAEVLAYHYSTDRVPQYCKETRFEISADKGIDVVYTRLDTDHRNQLLGGNQVVDFNCPVSTRYSNGKTLSWEFIQIVTRDGWTIEEVGEFIQRYISILEIFLEQAGLTLSLSSPKLGLPGNFFDIVPQNIIIAADGSPFVIDTEWSLRDEVKLGHLLFRGLLLMIEAVTRFGQNSIGKTFSRLEFIQSALGAVGFILTEKEFSSFKEVESSVQAHVTGRSAREFLSWSPNQHLPQHNLRLAVAERDGQIANLTEVVAERDGQIAERDGQIAERDGQIASLTEVIAERNNYIQTLVNSKSWLITKPIRWLGRIVRGDFTTAMDPIKRRLPLGSSVALPSNTDANLPPKKHRDYSVTSSPINPTHPVAVILPVYRGVEMTKRCIIAAMPGILAIPGSRIIAINDASPDIDMQEMLENLANRWTNVLVVLKNENNLGFVGSVNRGFSYFPQHDIVILNSDVIVPQEWLGRLIDEAYSRDNVGTVTPFSNNATICSFPEFLQENVQQFNLDVNSIDAIFKRDKLPCVEAPTGVGFCMYIRRACLDRIGCLNQEKFGRGYGEENDLCQRAIKNGWLNIISPNIYAYHEGGVSFSSEKQALGERAMRVIDELHPNYHADIQTFIRADPLKEARLTRFTDLLAALPIPKVLHISHGLGGGVKQHIAELADHLGKQSFSMIITPQNGETLANLRFGFKETADEITVRLPENYSDLVSLLRGLGITVVHFHHVMNVHPQLLNLPRDLKVKHYLTIHDYYLINGNPTLTNDRGDFTPHVHNELQNHLGTLDKDLSPEDWREPYRLLVETAEFVIFPSVATKILFGHFYQIIHPIVAYHLEIKRNITQHPKDFSRKDGYIIGVLGALGREKGPDYLEEIACHSKSSGLPLTFLLIGYAYRPLNVVKVTGPYESNKVQELIQTYNCDVIFFPARCPETYSYTLSAALESGLPIVAPSIGAFPERLAGRKHVMLYEHDIPAHRFLHALNGFLKALQTDDLHPAPDFQGELANPAFYEEEYLERVTHTPILAPKNGELLRRQAIKALLINGISSERTRKERLLKTLWRLYAHPSMGWVSIVIPYKVRRSVKRWLSRRPIHDIVGAKKNGHTQLMR